MLELLLTAGGSAGFGSLLKIIGGFFDSINAARESREQRELARDLQNHENAIEFQKALLGSDGKYVRATRRLLALIGMCTLSALTLWSAVFPELQLVTIPAGGEGAATEILFGLFSFPHSTETVSITLGHIAVVAGTVVYPMIIGFYFTPGGRK